MEQWNPKTDLGKSVLRRDITDINQILDNGLTILEAGITDALLPNLQDDLLMIGQSKGKFGGGRRRVFRQTQKKTREGNKPKFAAYAVVGNGDGIVGMGYGKARETVPAREKALRQAKINVFKIARGSGSWESTVKEPHSIPFSVEGSCGSVIVQLFPAPKGKGLIAEKEIQKILSLAGVKDCWSRTFGQTKNKINLIKATEEALKKLVTTRLREVDKQSKGIVYGPENKQDSSSDKAFVQETAHISSVNSLSGVGPKIAKVLEEAGIRSIKQLSSYSIEDLSGIEGIGLATAKKILSEAKKSMEEHK